MSRCQHNQKITKFCVTPNCSHPNSGGCQYCFKRYHCHIGETITLKEIEAMEIIKELTSKEEKKIKIRPLKQAIYNYFNIVKGQLSNFLDSISSDLLNRITFPYLKKEGNLSIVKKLKHKQYNKLTTGQMIKLNEFKQRNCPQKLQMYQILSYFDEVRQSSKKIQAINNLYKNFQKEAEGYFMGECLMSVGIYYKKIINIIDNIQIEKNNLTQRFTSDLSKLPNRNETQKKSKNQSQRTVKNQSKPNAQCSQQNSLSMHPQQNLAVVKYETSRKKQYQDQTQVKTIDQNKVKKYSSGTQEAKQNLPTEIKENKLNRQRKISIDFRCNDFLGPSNLKTYEENQKQIIQRKIKLDQMLQKIQKKYSVSRSSQNSSKDQKLSKQTEKQLKQKNQNFVSSEIKSYQNNEQNDMIAHTLLPQNRQDQKFYQLFAAVQKKTLRIPVNVIQQNAEGQQCQSPIVKLKQSGKPKQNTENSGLQLGLFKVHQIHQTISKDSKSHLEPSQIPKEESKNSSQQMNDKQNTNPLLQQFEGINVTQKEENSIILLAQSIKQSAKKAIPLLEAALKYAPHNFSAAEYLSFLYLQQNKPKQSLRVCNQSLKLILGQANAIEISFHLFNNKAAALNMLGRFSESIPILEKCIQAKKKDLFYKNLGDAYFSLGIIEKAIINYQNALTLNEDNHEALYNLSVCLYLQKNYDSSKLKVQRALLLDRQNQDYIDLYKKIDVILQQQKAK